MDHVTQLMDPTLSLVKSNILQIKREVCETVEVQSWPLINQEWSGLSVVPLGQIDLGYKNF